MPHFYLDVDDGVGPMSDDQGADFADQAAGEREAVKLLTTVGAEELSLENYRVSVNLRTELGAVVFSVRLAMTCDRA